MTREEILCRLIKDECDKTFKLNVQFQQRLAFSRHISLLILETTSICFHAVIEETVVVSIQLKCFRAITSLDWQIAIYNCQIRSKDQSLKRRPTARRGKFP